MESTIKHEILHILSMHLLRAKKLKDYSKLALNMAMNVVVNKYLDNLPPYAVTLEWVNLHYSLELLPFKPFEYYAENIQAAIDLQDENDDQDEVKDKDKDKDESEDKVDDDNPKLNSDEKIETDYNPEKAHDIWEDSSSIDEKTLQEFTEKYLNIVQKDNLPNYLEGLISSLKNSKGELPWNLYLKRLMGTVAGHQKKTITRRNRRQPDRLDLRGQLRNYLAKIVVALDISGSISDAEFNQAIKEVLDIVKNYKHEITIVECDSDIRRVYDVKTVKDVKERIHNRGGTKFTPVFEYANHHRVNLLVYFTDGKGENKLQALPRGYKTLWVLSGGGDELSLEEAYGAVKKLKIIAAKDETLTMSDVRRDGYSMNDQESMHI